MQGGFFGWVNADMESVAANDLISASDIVSCERHFRHNPVNTEVEVLGVSEG